MTCRADLFSRAIIFIVSIHPHRLHSSTISLYRITQRSKVAAHAFAHAFRISESKPVILASPVGYPADITSAGGVTCFACFPTFSDVIVASTARPACCRRRRPSCCCTCAVIVATRHCTYRVSAILATQIADLPSRASNNCTHFVFGLG